MNRLRLYLEILAITANRFVLHDAWAIASHIALSVLVLYGTGWLTQSLYSYAAHVVTLAVLFCGGLLCFWVLTGVDPLPRPVPWAARARLLAAMAVVQLVLGTALLFGPGLGLDWFPLVAPLGVSDLSADQGAAGWAVLVIALFTLGCTGAHLAAWRHAARRRQVLVSRSP